MNVFTKRAIVVLPVLFLAFSGAVCAHEFSHEKDSRFTAAEKETLTKFHKLQYCGRAKWGEAEKKSDLYKQEFVDQGGDVKNKTALRGFVSGKIGDAVSDECIAHIGIDEPKESAAVDAFIKKYGKKVWNKVSPAPVPHLGFIPPPSFYAP